MKQRDVVRTFHGSSPTPVPRQGPPPHGDHRALRRRFPEGAGSFRRYSPVADMPGRHTGCRTDRIEQLARTVSVFPNYPGPAASTRTASGQHMLLPDACLVHTVDTGRVRTLRRGRQRHGTDIIAKRFLLLFLGLGMKRPRRHLTDARRTNQAAKGLQRPHDPKTLFDPGLDQAQDPCRHVLLRALFKTEPDLSLLERVEALHVSHPRVSASG